MLYTDTVGLPQAVRSLRRFAAEPGADASWQPAPLLVRLAEEGRSFQLIPFLNHPCRCCLPCRAQHYAWRLRA